MKLICKNKHGLGAKSEKAEGRSWKLDVGSEAKSEKAEAKY